SAGEPTVRPDLPAQDERGQRAPGPALVGSSRRPVHVPAPAGAGRDQLAAELAIRFGVILRKVWGGSRTWAGARAQSVLMSVWRTCWQHGRSALDFLSQLLRGPSAALALPP